MPGIAADLLDWYRATGRDLPWRRTTDPYRILVSEVMLQQTQVDRVIPKYEAFLARFPTAEKLARAPLGDVLKLWSGLGYNRRAKHLWLAAQAVVREHGGVLPSGAEQLRELPGIGPYTAAALSCFAFDTPAAPLDTNLRRVLSRIYFKGDAGDFEAKAIELIRMAPREVANALMDLGATVCMPAPKCDACPLRKHCTALKAGVPEKYPAPPKQSKFEGSRRSYRGKLLKLLRTRTLTAQELPAALGLNQKTATGIAAELEREGLLKNDAGVLRLP